MAGVPLGSQGMTCTGLCLQPDIASQRGALQLLDALDRKGGKTPAHPAYPMPTGFLEDLAARFETEGLEDMLGPSGVAHIRLQSTHAEEMHPPSNGNPGSSQFCLYGCTC